MYQTFSVVAYDAMFAEKKIIVYTTYNVDPNSVNDVTVKVYNNLSRLDDKVSFEVVGKDIHIYLEDEIVPNTEYTLVVSKIKTILGDELISGIRRKVIFKSEVIEIPSILSPSMHEELSSLKINLISKINDEEVKISDDKYYYIEVATDIAFINKTLDSKTENGDLVFRTLPNGQYYIRARVVNRAESIMNIESQAGRWSETVSFIMVNKPDDEDIDEPIFIKNLEVISYPLNGETPESIIIEFSTPVDPDFIDKISVKRRDI